MLVASEQDMAGRTMISSLLNDFGFEPDSDRPHQFVSAKNPKATLYLSATELLRREDLDQVFPHATAFVFLSKHRAESRIPALTCHCTGNFSDNPFGGNAGEIGISFPSLQKSYLNALVKDSLPDYHVVIEATHHGPTSLRKPLLFVELGSSEKQWADKNAASLICRTVLDVIQRGPGQCAKVAIGLGGTHYPTKFSQFLIESNLGLAAVASKHNLQFVNEAMLKQMQSKSIEPVTTILLDSKGLGTHKRRIIELAQKSGLEILNLK